MNHITGLFGLLITVASVLGSASAKANVSTLDSTITAIANSTEPLEKAELNYQVAMMYVDSALDKSLHHARSCYQIALQHSQDTLLHEALNIIRYIHYVYGDYENLLIKSLEALRIAERIPNLQWVADNHGWLMMAQIELGNKSKALEEAMASRDASLLSKDTVYICRGFTDMMSALKENERYEEAAAYGYDALTLNRKIKDQFGEAFTLTELADLHNEQGRFREAIDLAQASKLILDKEDDQTVYRLWNLNEFAEAYLGLGETEMAQLQIAEASKIATMIGATKELMELLEMSSDVAEQKGEYSTALHFYKRFKSHNDSIVKANNAQKMMGLQSNYDLEAKSVENSRLQELNKMNQAHLQSSEKANLVLWAVAAFLFVMTVIMFFFGFRTRRMKHWIILKEEQISKQNEILREKQLELEQQQIRLHDSLVSDALKGERLASAEKVFVDAVTRQYDTVENLAALLIKDNDNSLARFVDRVRNVERTVLNSYNGTVADRTAFEYLAKQIVAKKAADFSSAILPMISVHTGTLKLVDSDRFRIGMILHELVTISYSSLQEDGVIQFIHVELTETEEGELKVAYHTNEDPFAVDTPNKECEQAREVLRELCKQMGGRTRVMNDNFRRFELYIKRVGLSQAS